MILKNKEDITEYLDLTEDKYFICWFENKEDIVEFNQWVKNNTMFNWLDDFINTELDSIINESWYDYGNINFTFWYYDENMTFTKTEWKHIPKYIFETYYTTDNFNEADEVELDDSAYYISFNEVIKWYVVDKKEKKYIDTILSMSNIVLEN
jgi:hypothetical protein